MYSNGKSNGKSEDGSASATVFISEPKILDLNALLGRKNGSNYVPPKTNAATPSYTPRPMAFQTPKPSPIFKDQLINKLNDLSHKTSQNNSNVQSNNHPDTSPIKRPKSEWSSRLCFSGDYLFYKDNNLTTREYGESGFQFKCTYPGCHKRLSTNVNFINHILVHTQQLHLKQPSTIGLRGLIYGTGDNNPRLVNEKAPIHCTDCLSEFTLPQKLYKHQFYVHQSSSNTHDCIKMHPVCHICEKEIDLANTDKHADRHSEAEMPYDCPICSWRSSSRQALLFHIEKQHNANTMLICPYCLETYNSKRPSAIKSQRTTILTSTQFVDHILEHFQDGAKKSNCSRCSLKFCADSYGELANKLKAHNEMHKSGSRLRFERKSLKELFVSNPNQRTADIKALSPMCTDCGYLVKSVDSHYRKKQTCENSGCQFETRCKVAFKQHSSLCPFREGSSSSRFLLEQSTVVMNSLNKERIRLKCSLCSFVSKDSAIFNDHLAKECIGAKPVFGSKHSLFHKMQRKRELTEDECEEIDLFGLESSSKRLKDAKSEEKFDFLEMNSDKTANWLSKVVPFISDRNLIVFKKSAIVNTVSIIDNTSTTSATNEFFDRTKFFDEDNEEKQISAMKLAQKLFPPSRFPQRR